MKKVWVGVIVLGVLGGLIFWLSQGGMQTLAQSMDPQNGPVETEVAYLPPVVSSRDINVTGRLIPARQMDLSFNIDGKILEIFVAEGDTVVEGQVIARLREEREMKLAVSRANLEVLNAEKVIKDLANTAPLLAAQINFDITQEEEALEKAEKKRLAMDYPKATQENIDNAYKDYTAAADVVKQIEGYGSLENKEIRDAYNEAVNVRNITLSKYNYLISKYSDAEISEAEAVVMLHKRQLDDLQRRYAIYSAGPDPDEEKIAQARLEIARAELAAAEARFADMELRAPFDGTIVSMELEKDQLITPGQPVLLLADLGRWNIETEDLTELSVTRIYKGAPATIQFDALPEKTFEGKVKTIKDIGVTKQGDITYTAVIELDESDPLFRWNMTSPIVIETE